MKPLTWRVECPPTFLTTKKRDAFEQLADWLTAQQREGWAVIAPVVTGTSARCELASTHPQGLVLLQRTDT